MEGGLQLIRFAGLAAEIEQLQSVLENVPRYYKATTGAVAEKGAAQHLQSILPDDKTAEDKFLFGIFSNNKIIGCTDVIMRFDDENSALIGLLVLAEPYQNSGFGRKVYELIEQQIKAQGCNRIWLAVVAVNAAVQAFWEKMGFTATGETRPYTRKTVTSHTILMEKRI